MYTLLLDVNLTLAFLLKENGKESSLGIWQKELFLLLEGLLESFFLFLVG